jgi:hypothetical protein
MTPEAKRDYLVTFVANAVLVAKAEAQDGRRRRFQAQGRLARTAADGAVGPRRSRGERSHDAKVYDDAIGQMKKGPGRGAP